MCNALGLSRSSYYKKFDRAKNKSIGQARILKLVRKERSEQPRVGTRKLYKEISSQLKADRIHCGRDRLFALLKDKNLLIAPKKRFKKTTYSNHSYAVSPNLVKDLEINKPNQVFVCDITYISLKSGFAYLSLVTDAYSRKIVGYHLSRDLGHYSTLMALNKALQKVPYFHSIICHSDRGCQYCCHQYLEYLKQSGLRSSMTSESHCYQNAIAERVNGILKDEFDLDQVFNNFGDAKSLIDKIISTYNTKRKHWSLNLKTPDFVYASAA